jgi:hypothetical protein
MSNPDMNNMNRRAGAMAPRRARWLLAAIGTLAASIAGAALPLKTIEECVETGTRAVSLPGVASGSLSASPCAGCPIIRLRFDGGTRYLIGKQVVTYAKFRAEAAKGDDLRLDVFYEPKTRTLTRLRLAATGNAQ